MYNRLHIQQNYNMYFSTYRLRAARWINVCFAFLSSATAIKIILLLIFLPIIILVNSRSGGCTCADQIPDKKLDSQAREGNIAIINYQNTKDNTVMCAARRKKLLDELKRKSKAIPLSP